jgi:hypothetical protein
MATHKGIKGSASFTPTAASYTAVDSISTVKEFKFEVAQNGLAVPAGSLIRITTSELKIDHTALVAAEGAYTLHLYTATPPSAFADNAAWTLTSADLPFYAGAVAVGTPVDLGAGLYLKVGTHVLDVTMTSSSLFGYLVNAGTMTPTAVARQITLLGYIV